MVKNMEISFRLQEERKRLELTQEALASKLGTTKRSVINWEGGAALPGAEVLAKYASAGADALYILTGKPSQPLESRLSQRAKKLLDNYESASDDAKRLIEGTAKLAAHPPVPADGQATK